MAIDIGAVFREALDAMLTRAGAAIAVAFVAIGLADAVIRDTLSARIAERQAAANATGGPGNATEAAGNVTETATATMTEVATNATETATNATGGLFPTLGTDYPLASDLSMWLAFALFLGVFLVGEGLRLVAIRDFGAEYSRFDELLEDWPRTYGFLVVVTIALQLLTQLGIQLFLAPALVVAILFYFVRQEVVLAGKGIVDAFRDSFDLARNNVLEVLALLAGIFALQLIVTQPIGYLPLEDWAIVVLRVIPSRIITLFGVAVSTVAYGHAVADADAPPPSAEDLDDENFADVDGDEGSADSVEKGDGTNDHDA